MMTLTAPELVEEIDEKFDSVSTAMTDNSLIYGSGLTSLVSGLRADGDLDIVVCDEDFMTVAGNFADSTAWLQIAGSTIPEAHNSSLYARLRRSSPSSSDYGERTMPISETALFENVNSRKVQIIRARSSRKGVEAALEVISCVDMRFCGLALDRYGELIEVVPGAYQDCLDRRMRLNRIDLTFNATSLKERITKYVRRGWLLDIDVNKAIDDFRRLQSKQGKVPSSEPSGTYAKIAYPNAIKLPKKYTLYLMENQLATTKISALLRAIMQVSAENCIVHWHLSSKDIFMEFIPKPDVDQLAGFARRLDIWQKDKHERLVAQGKIFTNQ